MPLIIDNEDFENIDFTAQGIDTKEFESCTFINCTFSELDLQDISFEECRFEHCDLGTIKVKNTAFKKVVFDHCRCMGIDFAPVNPFLLEMDFSHTILDFSSFHGLDLRKFRFDQCRFRESDLSGSDLRGVNLRECDLTGCLFERTDLRDADFSTAHSYSIDPEQNLLDGIKCSLAGLPGLLERHGIRIDGMNDQ